MKLDFIKQIMSEFDQSNVTKMKVEIDDLKIELEKESEKVEYVKPLEKENKMVAEVNTKEPTGTPVKSPIVGVFYSASSPESDPYVTVGKTVKKGLWSHKLFLFGLLALFSYEIAEISINSFFINYVVDDGWMNARDAAVVLSFGGLGLFMCGRFAGSWIMQRIRAERVLLYCALGTVAATFLIVCNLGKISLVALFLVYVFEAIMFPTIFAISLKGLGNKTKRASSFLMMSPVGGAIGPVLMGYVADNSNMSLSFIIPFVSFCVVLFYSWYADVEGN